MPSWRDWVGYIICTTTMEAFDADDAPLGTFLDRYGSFASRHLLRRSYARSSNVVR
jgi:hypothetical protein